MPLSGMASASKTPGTWQHTKQLDQKAMRAFMRSKRLKLEVEEAYSRGLLAGQTSAANFLEKESAHLLVNQEYMMNIYLKHVGGDATSEQVARCNARDHYIFKIIRDILKDIAEDIAMGRNN